MPFAILLTAPLFHRATRGSILPQENGFPTTSLTRSAWHSASARPCPSSVFDTPDFTAASPTALQAQELARVAASKGKGSTLALAAPAARWTGCRGWESIRTL